MLQASLADPAPTTRFRIGWRAAYAVVVMALSWYCTALGWQAQLVSYPLFRSVSPEDFLAYHRDYNSSIPFVVIVPGFVTFLAGAAFVWARPGQISRLMASTVAAANTLSLVATVLWAIPRHDELDRSGQATTTIDSLLSANLVRSLALTASAVLMTWVVFRLVAERVDHAGRAPHQPVRSAPATADRPNSPAPEHDLAQPVGPGTSGHVR